ncbi:MAG: OmpA family protein [Phycisphaerales bacterium]|nr:OmpA family protein [Planctomycetota bacterium]MCH8508529.1 OmpA family protein [Phycisphaerales bacterium]
MAKRKPRPKAEVPEWVVTYGDLMSLLLTFFILLAAFSELKQPREYQKVLDAIKEALGVQGGMGVSQVRDSTNNSMVNFFREKAKRDGDLRNTQEDIDPSVVGRQDKSAIIQEGALHAIGGSIIFEPGSADLSRTGREMLRNEVAPKIRGLRYITRVVGHAWGMEDRRQGYSHDELAFRRANAVTDFLVRECGVDAAILRTESAGDHEPMVLAAGPGQDDGVNRRVQIYQSGRTIEQVHPDPNFTGSGN